MTLPLTEVCSEVFISTFQSLYANSRSRVRAYDDLTIGFTTEVLLVTAGTISTTLFSFFSKIAMEIVLSLCENSALDICSEKSLSDLEYTDQVVLLSEDSSIVLTML